MAAFITDQFGDPIPLIGEHLLAIKLNAAATFLEP
jgi:hypothetical protein